MRALERVERGERVLAQPRSARSRGGRCGGAARAARRRACPRPPRRRGRGSTPRTGRGCRYAVAPRLGRLLRGAAAARPRRPTTTRRRSPRRPAPRRSRRATDAREQRALADAARAVEHGQPRREQVRDHDLAVALAPEEEQRVRASESPNGASPLYGARPGGPPGDVHVPASAPPVMRRRTRGGGRAAPRTPRAAPRARRRRAGARTRARAASRSGCTAHER